MKVGSTIALALMFAATVAGEELPRKTKTPRESYPNVDVIYDSVTAPRGERLRTIITNHVHLITSRSTSQGNNPVTIVVDEVAGLTVAQRRKIDQRKRAYVDLIREALSELKESGKLRDLDVIAATFSLLGMILWLSRWYSPEGRLTPDQVSEEVTKIALSGLLRPEA